MNNYRLVDHKRVRDSDGFWTDYVWYKSRSGHHVFMYGDMDWYLPVPGYFDYECDSEKEAEEWFDGYSTDDDEENRPWLWS